MNKLDREDIEFIRDYYLIYTDSTIANFLGISEAHLRNIVNKKFPELRSKLNEIHTCTMYSGAVLVCPYFRSVNRNKGLLCENVPCRRSYYLEFDANEERTRFIESHCCKHEPACRHYYRMNKWYKEQK